MQVKQICTVLALALICACEMEAADDLTEESSLQQVTPGDVLDKIADAKPGSMVKFPQGTPPEQIDAAMEQLHAKLQPNPDNPEELVADREFERSLSKKQLAGLDKVKDAYTEKVAAGDIRPVRKDGDWALEVKGPPSGEEPEPPKLLGPPEHVRPDDGSTVRPEDGSTRSLLPHFADNYYSWSTSWKWWGIKISVDHEFLYVICNFVSWFVNNSSMAGWLKWALSFVGCLPHTLDSPPNGGACYVTWIGIAWCTV